MLGGMTARTVAATLSLALVVSCAGPAARPPARAPAPRPTPPAPPAAAGAGEEPILIGRTLIWPVRHGHAEELAATLQPILERQFGPGVVIVPQMASNRLLIQLPSPREREMQRSRQAPVAAR
jgi:hypothetical protein